MNNDALHRGVVVPMVTPVTDEGTLDAPAADRMVDFLLAGGVQGIFVLGTTGEGASVPRTLRRQFVERVAQRAQGQARVYAGVGDLHPEDAAAGNEYLRAGADAIVARPPDNFPVAEVGLWFRKLLDGLDGPVILYNMPLTTKVSIPLDVVAGLVDHPKVVGIKDSENNPQRLEELLRRFGGVPGFSIFVGVGALMAQGMKLGAEGIVPSVGNLIPQVCRSFWESAAHGDWGAMEGHFLRMNQVAALYQRGRSLGESLAALKAAVHLRGFCTPQVLPPLVTLAGADLERLRLELSRLSLLG